MPDRVPKTVAQLLSTFLATMLITRQPSIKNAQLMPLTKVPTTGTLVRFQRRIVSLLTTPTPMPVFSKIPRMIIISTKKVRKKY
jgi:hypothetical protein